MNALSSIQGTHRVATANFDAAASDEFPSLFRRYKVETTVKDRVYRDYAAVNSDINNGDIQDGFLEFLIAGTDQDLIDLKSLAIELKIKIQRSNGANLDPADVITIIDAFPNRLLAKNSLFFNSVQVDGSSFFGLTSSIKNYCSLDENDIHNIGRNLFYKSRDTALTDVYNANYFQNVADGSHEAGIIESARGLIHTITPLNLDIASANTYLLSGVDVRLRFELSTPSLLINAGDNNQYRYRITSAKLWAMKVVPHAAALLSLNKSLMVKNQPIEYIYDKTVVKTVVFPTGHNSITIDNLFSGIVPTKLFVFMVDQTALNGDFTRNGAYFPHNDIRSARLEIDGNTHSNIRCQFDNSSIAQIYHQTISSLDSDKHSISYNAFKNGRFILAYNLAIADTADGLNVDRHGSIRFSLDLGTALLRNYTLFFFGITTGAVSIDTSRRVFTNFLL